jgi:hypothetical protein
MRDRSALSESDVSPEMIEAGLEVYLNYCPDRGAGDSLDRHMVQEIFEAMRRSYFQAGFVD